MFFTPHYKFPEAGTFILGSCSFFFFLSSFKNFGKDKCYFWNSKEIFELFFLLSKILRYNSFLAMGTHHIVVESFVFFATNSFLYLSLIF